MPGDWVDDTRTTLEAPSPAVRTTCRKDDSAAATPPAPRRDLHVS